MLGSDSTDSSRYSGSPAKISRGAWSLAFVDGPREGVRFGEELGLLCGQVKGQTVRAPLVQGAETTLTHREGGYHEAWTGWVGGGWGVFGGLNSRRRLPKRQVPIGNILPRS